MTVDPRELAEIHALAFDAPWDATALSALIDRPGAVVEADPDGFVLLQIAADEAEVLTLAVRPSARRRGLARTLMDRGVARAAAQGARRIFLEVAEDNLAARGLYAAQGFEATGRRAGYYARADGAAVDALLLALILPETLP